MKAMMQYREPINISDIVSEVRRLWIVPAAVAAVFALAFVVMQGNADASFEQRVDVVGSDVERFADAVGAPNVVERFDAAVVAQSEQSKLEVINNQSGSVSRVRVQGSPQTNTVSVFGSGTSREEAVQLAESYAAGIVETQRDTASVRLNATRTQLENELTRIQNALDSTTAPDDSERIVLLVDRSTTIRFLAGLSSLEQGAGGGVRDPELIGSAAEVKHSSLVTYAALGALLGLVLGVGAVILRRLMSKKVFGEEDLARYGSTVPVLADINNTDGASKGVFAALASAIGTIEEPGRVPGVLLSSVVADSVPDELGAGVLAGLPELGINGVVTSSDALTTIDPQSTDDLFHVVVVDEAIRDSSSAIAAAGRLASTVIVVRRRKTSIAQTLEAVDLVHQGGGQLRGIVIVD